MLIVGSLAAACATEPPDTSEPLPPAAHSIPVPNSEPTIHQIETLRTGRYTLVELAPDEGQRDPLRQIVVVMIPPAFDTTVGSAMSHVLARTGYRLCSPPPAFVSLPLPAAHLRLGPTTLANALQTLAGPAWALTVEHVERRVCFTRSEP
jgi:type IV pili sensor histidine kinase/response regulator